MELAYDMQASWEENWERGPKLPFTVDPVPETPSKRFLGKEVRSRIGIAAGLLLNGRWIDAYARRGFDLLTYKTVRTRARACYPPPNWVFVREGQSPEEPVVVMEKPGPDPTKISSSVCFGMPSVAPEIWRPDIESTRNRLLPGQFLLVSVVGTADESTSQARLIEDFVLCAHWAAEAGADGVEVNLSCPNVCTLEGTIYQDLDFSGRILSAIRDRVPKTPLLVKVGLFPNEQHQREFVRSLHPWINGITLVNCISRAVIKPDGSPAFGPNYPRAGVLGRAIHKPSVDAIRSLRATVSAEGLSLEVVAVGGVSTVHDFNDFFSAGADAVLCGSSPMYLPELARQAKRVHPEW